MSMLTEAQIRDAPTSELVETMRAISSYLDNLRTDAILRATREALVAQRIAGGVRVTVGTDEWDDGYFYSGVDEVSDEQGVEITLSTEQRDALDAALHEDMTELSRNGPALGRSARCTIDVGAWTVRR